LQITVAVLSAARAGKTVFIQKALDLRRPPSSPVSYSKLSLGDLVYKVGLVEFSLDEVDFSNGRRVSWPKHVNGELLPPIDGVLCLYDVTDQESIAEIPALLGKLHPTSAPPRATAPCLFLHVDVLPSFLLQLVIHAASTLTSLPRG